MLQLRAGRAVRFCDGMTRRDFLHAGALGAGAIGLSLADLLHLHADSPSARSDVNCILLFLVGGPSQLDTWDPKPDQPEEIRGPFAPIRTNVPGIRICEHFPKMAAMADRYAILRSVHHEAAPIHETGHQLMQTGFLFRGGVEHPHYGSVVSCLRGEKVSGVPPFVVLPGPIGNTGVSVNHGQTAGFLGAGHEPIVSGLAVDPARMASRDELVNAADRAQRTWESREQTLPGNVATSQAFGAIFAGRSKQAFDIAADPADLRAGYGWNTFGQSCVLARRLVESGVRLVTVNMFDTVFNQTTWDCHADGGSLASRLDDYKKTLCPMFDAAYTSLLEDLHQRGMLHNTLVVAMGEFGRTPKLNPRGGRDHWPGVWSILFAGAGVRGGQVIGSSDATAAEPRNRPISPMQVAATVYRALGIDPAARIPGPDNRPTQLTDAEAVHELF